MRKKQPTEWVIYKAAVEKNLGGHNAVCSQEEWNDLERQAPGQHTLIREHIANEAEAEQLARSMQTVPPVPKVVKPSALMLRKQAERAARMAAANLNAAPAVATTPDEPSAEPETAQ